MKKLKTYYAKSFARVATLIYCMGIIMLILSLIGILPITEMPNFVHYVIILFAGYGGIGFIVYSRKVKFKNIPDKIVFGLIIFHLNISAILHIYSIIANSNEWIGAFPEWYPYLAIVYFASFAYYSFRLNFRLKL